MAIRLDQVKTYVFTLLAVIKHDAAEAQFPVLWPLQSLDYRIQSCDSVVLHVSLGCLKVPRVQLNCTDKRA